MEINVREKDGFTILDFKGNLDTNTTPAVEGQLNQILDRGVPNILLNFREVNFISSIGLRLLIMSARRLAALGGDLSLCNLNGTVQEVFAASGLSQILSVFDTEAEALAESRST